MTSKHCFSKIMREDIRHKNWMLVLSILAHLLMVVVAFLMSMGDTHRLYAASDAMVYVQQIQNLYGFFRQEVLITEGIVIAVGALIVGLGGFQYVYHRNRIDTWHSLPVKRNTLFFAGWLNGLLLWFVPFVCTYVLTLIIALSRLSKYRNLLSSMNLSETIPQMSALPTAGDLLIEALKTAGILILAFLLLYHLILLAVMLCGNVLNTLVLTAIIGVGVIAMYLLGICFQEIYLDTFVAESTDSYEWYAYLSPLVSFVYLLYLRIVQTYEELSKGLLTPVLVNLVIAVGLGVLAWRSYLKRPSELAEQGMRNRILGWICRLVVSVAAGLAGWLIFMGISSELQGIENATGWAVFGALLFGILSFGAIDVVFHMDFKAFLAHKKGMLICQAVVLLVAFGFLGDWSGFDNYLPKEEQIREISLCHSSSSSRANGVNSYEFLEAEHPINQVHITDQKLAYALLSEGVAFEKNRPDDDENWNNYYDAITREGDGNMVVTSNYVVKVTLKSGKTYYRRYCVTSENYDAFYAAITTPEYLEVNYRLPEEALFDENANADIRIYGMSGEERIREKDPGEKVMQTISAAYNRDLAEHPDAVVAGEGRILSTVSFSSGNRNSRRRLNVYEGMTYTREALTQLGYGAYAEAITADQIEEIRLPLDVTYWYLEEEDADLVQVAVERYGVSNGAGFTESGVYKTVYTSPATAIQEKRDSDEEIYLSITDPKEIEELLALISYDDYSGGLVYRKPMVYIQVRPAQQEEETDGNGLESAYLPYGTLPEKYLAAFAQLQESLAK